MYLNDIKQLPSKSHQTQTSSVIDVKCSNAVVSEFKNEVMI